MGFGVNEEFFMLVITDKEEINSIIKDFWHLAEDGMTLDKVGQNVVWLRAEGGAFALEPVNSITLSVHPMIKENSFNAGEKLIEWIKENTNYRKLVAEFPVEFKHIRRYVRHFGFQFEGYNKRSWLKDGKINDQFRYGLCL